MIRICRSYQEKDQLDKMRERISLLNATIETLRNESTRTGTRMDSSNITEKRGQNKLGDKESISLILEQVRSHIRPFRYYL